MEKKFHAQGKLLLTGEYLVMDGAEALALPSQLGQRMTVNKNENSFLEWKSWTIDNFCWHETIFDSNFKILKTNNQPVAETLQQLFVLATKTSNVDIAYSSVDTYLEFDQEWGLGSSSTLISLMAQWLEVSPYRLQFSVFGGSGYDIACADAKSSILYQVNNKTPNVKAVNFSPTYIEDIYFVYLGNKQNSRTGIKNYTSQKKLATNLPELIKRITEISNKIILQNCSKNQCIALLTEHEQIISSLMNMPSINDTLFSGFDGVAKSLGAWGGDFVMLVSNLPQQKTLEYIENLGLQASSKVKSSLIF